jgi:apolipoprotein D and lipocalin family protein
VAAEGRRLMRRSAYILALLAAALLQGGCQTVTTPMPTVPHVDLERFMGPWYVIANIPTFIEKGAHNAVESYRLDPDGTIATTFTFRAGGFDRQSNARWGMQFIWPIKADYRIIWLDEGYTQTVIGRESRDYVWIMARTPTIPDADYQRLLAFVAAQGYDVAQVQKVPQRWK